MSTPKRRHFGKLLARYKVYIIIGVITFLMTLIFAFLIYGLYTETDAPLLYRVANLLMSIAEAMLVAGIIGGGIGGGINFIFEEMKKEEEEAKERRKEYLENREKHLSFRQQLRHSLGSIHDNVGLARILIKSHKSGKTYGEQIRERIMPSIVSLQDIRRELAQVEDPRLKRNIDAFRISLNYLIAYLSVLVREFEAHYLVISNLQNYQDAFGSRLRTMFADMAAVDKKGMSDAERKKKFVEEASQLFEEVAIPDKIDAVWNAIRELDYVSDFIAELRDESGKRSIYFTYFLTHYNHCTRILRTKDSDVSKKLTSRPGFIANLEEIKRIDEKRKSDAPLTNQDMLTWRMMQQEMDFDLTTGTKRSKQD